MYFYANTIAWQSHKKAVKISSIWVDKITSKLLKYKWFGLSYY